ncbi:hypothetical protein H0H93_013513 [Arthromyces matolae]|nr:hypothetical protein H0H93_013513 [Arthromyces matolae]
MPRENSFSDSEGRSLTPDLDEVNVASSPASPSLNAHDPNSTPRHIAGLSIDPRSPSYSVLSRIKSKSPLTQKSHHHWPANGKVQTPIERFRSAVRKVMALHRGTSYLAGNITRVGAEPGVNPRRASANLLYGHIRQDCVIEVIDYSSVRSSFGRMTNREFVSLMNDPGASERESWAKVRWINISGMSWDVIKAVSIKYARLPVHSPPLDLHPLALEDVFHTDRQTRSKADYYSQHLFLRVLCHELGKEDDFSGSNGSILTESPRSSSPSEMNDFRDADKEAMREDGGDERTMYDSAFSKATTGLKKRRRFTFASSYPGPDLEGNLARNGSSLSSLGKFMSGWSTKYRTELKTFVQNAKKRQKEVTNNVTLNALKHRDTGLRNSADPALLVHALLDLVVDNALEVIDAFGAKINKFERTILLKSSVKAVRNLHILSGDLIFLKRTMEPVRTLVYGLRRYDLDRCQALIDTSDPKNADVKVVGFMSHKSQIYLADVYDHMDYILSSLDMFADITENLIGYAFNLASYEMNQVMRRLTLATIIFLPLTLLTGYFGMNFEAMWSVNLHSDLLFWEIALPVMAVVVPMFMWSDIVELWHYVQKKMVARNAVKTIKQS